MERKFDDERETQFDQRETRKDVEEFHKEDEKDLDDPRGNMWDTRPDDREAEANLAEQSRNVDSEIGIDPKTDLVEIEEEVVIVDASGARSFDSRTPEEPTAEEKGMRPSVEANAGIVLNGRYMPPPEDKDGKRWIRHTALIQAGPQELYELWRDVEQAPKWQEQVLSVTRINPTRSHWVMESNGKKVEWDAEILRDEPGKRIVWRSVQGDSRNAGEVVFEKAYSERGTMVTLLQEFEMGAWANLWETIVGRNPKQAVIENLRHFKALAETGEIPRTYGQPHGPRGTIGKAKGAMYAEKEPPPPGHLRKAG